MKQFMIGNAHIDPVWFWRWQEGYHEVKATFRSALDRMNETEEFIFTCACADYYRWVEENAPDMFEEIRRRVSEGRWVIAGGMWIQPDMNVSSGESLARHLLYSQQYFKNKLGCTASVGYNVDSFGHNALLPQIYSKAGMDCYVWMRPGKHENPDIPEGGMIWQSPDGSSIRTYRIEGEYTGARALKAKLDKLFAFSARIEQPVMCFYGVGNHGGGPTIANLEEIKRYQAQEQQGGEVLFASPKDYFAELDRLDIQLPVWQGELQHHASGCYSTHSLSKRQHRLSENALLRMEKLNALSACLSGHSPNDTFITQGWRNLMFCEFHDAMGGCAAEDVLEDVALQLKEACSIAAREENAALQRISWQVDTLKGLADIKRSKEEDWGLWGIAGQGTPVVVFNPHEFDTEGTVHIRRPVRKVRDDDGNVVPAQRIRAGRTNGEDKWDAIFRARVPALGYRLYWVYLEEEEAQPQAPVSVTPTSMENALIRAEFDPRTGALTHLIDKLSGLDALREASSINLIDIEHCDTWAHNVFKFDKPAGEFTNAKIRILEQGAVRAVLSVELEHGASTIEQRFTLYADSDQLEVEVVMDIHERHRMIKLTLPTAFEQGIDVAEIPYGALERTACGNEEPCQRWCGIQGKQGGLALINDGRYSYSAQEGKLCLTLANTSIYADHYGQQQRDELCRYMDQGEMKLCYALRPYAGDWQEQGLHRRAAALNQRLPFVVETYHAGKLKPEYSGIKLSNAAIALGALKRAEDGRGYVIRLAEATGRVQQASISIPLLGRTLERQFAPFEIATIYLPDDKSIAPYETLLSEL